MAKTSIQMHGKYTSKEPIQQNERKSIKFDSVAVVLNSFNDV